MKKLFFSILLLHSYLVVFCQRIPNEESTNSSISEYLSKSLQNEKISDSCFSGIYFVKFSLGKNQKVYNYTFSDDTPEKLHQLIKLKLDSISKIWKSDFASMVVKKRKTIVIPLLVSVESNCKTSNNDAIQNMDIDSSGSLKFQNQLCNATLIEFAKKLVAMQETFSKSLVFKNDSKGLHLDCILLDPCILIQRVSDKHKM